MLDDPDPDVRAFAAACLSHSLLADRILFPVLPPLFKDDRPLRYRRDFGSAYDPVGGRTVREAAIYAAQDMPVVPGAPSPLLATANHPEATIREACLLALSREKHSRDWLPTLEAALADENDRVFHAAVRHIGPRECSLVVLDRLTAALNEESRMRQAIAALTRLGPASRHAVDRLGAMLSRGQHEREVLDCLSVIGPCAEPALPEIRHCLNSSNPETRLAAARAMWQVAQDADEALLVCLELLPDRQSRWLACSALADMKSAAAPAVPALVELLESNPGNAVGVVKALGEIGPAAESALPALDALAANPTSAYAPVARKAASQIRGIDPARK